MAEQGISVYKHYIVDADPFEIKFPTLVKAIIYRDKLKVVQEIEALLPNSLREDPRFQEGEGYYQHDPQKVIEYRRAAREKLWEYEGELLRGFQRVNDCFAALGMTNQTRIQDLPLDKILSENDSPFFIIFSRLDYIDELSREWGKHQTRKNQRLN